MLVLSRHEQESIVLTLPGGQRVTILVVQIRSHDGRVRLGFEAPADVVIHRSEVQERVDLEAGSGPGSLAPPTPDATFAPRVPATPPGSPVVRPRPAGRPDVPYVPRKLRGGL